MQLKELRAKEKKELLKLLAQSREKLRGLRFSVSAKQLKNIREVRGVRKLIARTFTILKEKNAVEDNQENS